MLKEFPDASLMDSWKRFCDWHSVSLHALYGVPVSAMVARGKTSAGSLFYHISQSCKCQQMKIKRRYFVPKVINIGLDLLELFEHITDVRNFLRHSIHVAYSIQRNVNGQRRSTGGLATAVGGHRLKRRGRRGSGQGIRASPPKKGEIFFEQM